MAEKRRYEDIEVTGLTQAGGDQIILVNRSATFIQVSATGTSGTLGFSVRVREDKPFIPIADPLNPQQQQTLDLASPNAFQFSGFWQAIRVEPSTVTGTYDVLIQQGDRN